MLVVSNPSQEQTSARITVHPDDKSSVAGNTSVRSDGKGPADRNYDTGNTQLDRDTAQLINILRCLAPGVNNKNTYSDIEARMAHFRDGLAGQELDLNAQEFAQSNLGRELNNVDETHKAVAAAIASSDVDLSTLEACQQKLARVTVNASDAMVSDIRNRAVTTHHTLTQTKARLLAQDKGSSDSDTSISYEELWQSMADSIGNIKTQYVDKYANLMKAYTDMYKAYNETVQKAVSDAVGTGKDGNNVTFDATLLKKAYADFESRTKKINDNLGSINGWANMDDIAKGEAKTTMAPAFNVDDNGKITFDLSQYNGRPYYPSGVNGNDTSATVSTAAYQAWLASFNANGAALQSNMQSFAQRYSQAQSTFDNLNKVLSGAIASLAESAKQVFKNLT